MKDIFKKLLKTATQILKLGDSKTIAASENFIGTGYFAVKKEVIKTLDTVFAKRAEDVKNFNYEKLVPSVINNDYELVENIEVRKNYTQLISKSVTSYLNTSYYIFFNNYIKDLQLYIKNAVDPVILSNKNNEILGIILPIRVQNGIVLKGSGIIDSDIIDIDNTHVYINVENLDHEEKDKLQNLGFKRFSKGRYIKVFSHDILRNLGFSLSHEVFENDMTLEELKEELRQKDIKKEIKQNMVIESYEKLLPFYQNIINNLINDGYKIKGLSIKLSPKKTCYYFYIDTDKKEFDLGFICNKGNLDLNKTQQKALFKMLKDTLVLEDKINDLLTSEVASETNINDLYSVTYENDDKKKDIIANNNLNEVNMNIQLLAADKKESKLNTIKQLEGILNKFNNALTELNSMDAIYDNKDFININNFVNNYRKENSISDTFYFNINDIIDNVAEKIEEIKEVVKSDVNELYKNELNYHSNKYGKLEISEPKKKSKEGIKYNDIIELSTLYKQRKIIKSSQDKIYKILESEETKNGRLSELYFQLNALNEDIKGSRKIDKNVLIDNINNIRNNLIGLMLEFDNKRRLKTFNTIYDNISEILYNDILKFTTVTND